MILDTEFRKLMPKLTRDEYSKLEQHIVNEGCRDAIITWNDILINGYNRYEICTKHNIEFKTISMPFDNREAVSDWIIDNQLGQRNLTVEQKNYLIGKKYKKAKQAHGGDRKSSAKNLHLKTEEKIAQEHKISHATVRNNEKFADAVDVIAENVGDDVRDKILSQELDITTKDVRKLAKQKPDIQKKIIEKFSSGKISVDKVYRQVKENEKAKEDLSRKAEMNKIPLPERYQLFVGDFAAVAEQIKPASIDTIITDPPYSKNFLPLYEKLAQTSVKLLKPGGSMLVIVGQSYLPEILQCMTPYITYHWTLTYLTPGGQAAQLWQRNVNTFWKPVLWFVKGEYEGHWIGDVIKSKVNDKRYHHWGQSESGIGELVERFSCPNDTILDPFVGGGTTGVVAIRMNRSFIGIDIDANAIETTTKRLESINDIVQ